MNLTQLRKGLTIVFQPIHDLGSGEITGFEALSRCLDGPKWSPDRFLRLAHNDVLDEVEMLCFKLAVEESIDLPGNGFYNFSPDTLTRHYREIVRCLGTMCGRTVIELVEYSVPEGTQGELLDAICELHSAGIKVAIDDVGNGDRDFSTICELPVDIMKIDRRIIQGLTLNGSAPRYQIILNALVGLARKLNMSIIAEGIETENQHCAVKMAGVHLAQGFYLSKPRPAIYWHELQESGVEAF